MAKVKEQTEDLRALTIRLRRPLSIAVKQVAALEERSIEQVATDAFLGYLALPRSRALVARAAARSAG